jgi:ferrous iron transport protein A
MGSIPSLSTMQSGEFATIAALDAKNELYLRLTAMGFRIGKQVQLLRSAAFSGPLHVRIGTTDIMLRRSEGERVKVTPVGAPTSE